MSADTAKLVKYIRDMAREMAKMADSSSMHFLRYLLFLVVEEANNLSSPESAADPEEILRQGD